MSGRRMLGPADHNKVVSLSMANGGGILGEVLSFDVGVAHLRGPDGNHIRVALSHVVAVSVYPDWDSLFTAMARRAQAGQEEGGDEA